MNALKAIAEGFKRLASLFKRKRKEPVPYMLGYELCKELPKDTECDQCDKANGPLYCKRTSYEYDEWEYLCAECIQDNFEALQMMEEPEEASLIESPATTPPKQSLWYVMPRVNENKDNSPPMLRMHRDWKSYFVKEGDSFKIEEWQSGQEESEEL